MSLLSTIATQVAHLIDAYLLLQEFCHLVQALTAFSAILGGSFIYRRTWKVPLASRQPAFGSLQKASLSSAAQKFASTLAGRQELQ